MTHLVEELRAAAQHDIAAMRAAALRARDAHAEAELMRHMLMTAQRVRADPPTDAVRFIVDHWLEAWHLTRAAWPHVPEMEAFAAAFHAYATAPTDAHDAAVRATCAALAAAFAAAGMPIADQMAWRSVCAHGWWAQVRPAPPGRGRPDRDWPPAPFWEHGCLPECLVMSVSVALLDAWAHLLELSRLAANEAVVILLGEESHPAHVAAARLAIAQVGSTCVTLQLGEASRRAVAGESTAYLAPTGLAGNRPAQVALEAADLVVDLMGLYRGSEQEAILAAGTRILLVKEPPEVFMRLLPVASDRTRVLAADGRLRAARTMTVRSAAGTDFTVAFGAYPTLVQYGFADEPGRWDHCPSAFIARWPDEASSQGVVVLDEGDTILPFKSYVRSPIRLEIRDGYVRAIEGGLDARYLRDYMASFADPEGYAVSHLGWGLHERARWTMLGMYDKRQSNAMDARSYFGNFMFSTGPNAEGGGTRHTPCHLDIPMSSCSLWLDGEPILAQGNVLPAEMRSAPVR